MAAIQRVSREEVFALEEHFLHVHLPSNLQDLAAAEREFQLTTEEYFKVKEVQISNKADFSIVLMRDTALDYRCL